VSQALLAIVVAGVAAAFAAVAALVLRNAKKVGQKQAEADYGLQAARDAKAAGQVVAEHRTTDDAARRLSDGSF
jgi:hypothetical protein